MCNYDNDFVDESCVVGYLQIPFMHKVTEYHSDKRVQFKVDVCIAGQGRQNLIERFVVRGWTQNLVIYQQKRKRNLFYTLRMRARDGASRDGDASLRIGRRNGVGKTNGMMIPGNWGIWGTSQRDSGSAPGLAGDV